MPKKTPAPRKITQTLAQKERMRKRNAAFKRLTKPKQRVQIAQDVLAALRSGRFIANSVYFHVPVTTPGGYAYASDEVRTVAAASCQLSAVTSAPGVKCEVCGIGSLFVAAAERANHLKFEDYSGDVGQLELTDYLTEWFSEDQLRLVEACFERHAGFFDRYVITARRLVPHPWDGTPASKRMRMIMENIISNGGTFLPWAGKHKSKFPPVVKESGYFGSKDGEHVAPTV